LTVKALRLIQHADVVIYDRLVAPGVIDLIPAGTTRIFAGKASRREGTPQEEINEMLVAMAKQGRAVVRLKGGDPFVFGRGSEEAVHLVGHGIPFEVVPGITASTACAAYAGIPLTHRGLSKSVRVITGHRRNDAALDFDWRALADPETTLVIYMGLANLELICRELVGAGAAADTPAAAVHKGSTPDQRVVTGTLADLPAKVEAAGLTAPTLAIVGKVVALQETLDWFDPAAAADISPGGNVPGSDPL
jgi:uroporphyrin-III C-methyltransferase/precorrin-2 dehydrogenase/sirohydrochlorin ferrochelatase/uroporphyrin-III C-methyltransferase